MTSSSSSVSGFTLIELLLVVTIGAILTMIALPSFRSITQSQQVKNASYDLYSALSFTRSEAIKRNCNVTITFNNFSVNSPAPTHNEVGWTVDTNAASCGGTATKVRTQPQLKGVAITPAPSNPFSVTYQLTGRATATPTFLIDAYGTTTSNATCIKIELSGMPRMYQPVNGVCP